MSWPARRPPERLLANLAVGLALLSLGLCLGPMAGMWFGLSAGLVAITAGWTCYRHRGLPGVARLFGAASAAVALAAVTLATARVALSLAAAVHLERMLG